METYEFVVVGFSVANFHDFNRQSCDIYFSLSPSSWSKVITRQSQLSLQFLALLAAEEILKLGPEGPLKAQNSEGKQKRTPTLLFF